MIIYGWNSKIIKQAPLENYPCPNCQRNESHMIILAKYVHIFWIPVFPYKKSAMVFCTQCKLETHDEHAIMIGSDQRAIKKLKSAVALPIYLFSGLIIILLAIGYFTYAGAQDEKREAGYIETPEPGDVYLLKNDQDTTGYKYYLMKVRDVQVDSLWVSFSSYQYNGLVSKLDPEDGFYDVVFPMHKSVLSEFQKSGELQKVMRDYTESSGFNRDIEYQDEADTLLNID